MTAPATSRPGARRVRRLAAFGPAFVAAIAYVDPGNVAANTTAGAKNGYLLVWVLVAASAMAALVQYLSARLGLISGRSLPELIGVRLPRRARLAYWAQAEVVAAATDVAEVIGGALALNLLLGLPLLAGGVIVGIASLALLTIQSRRQQRRFELVIAALLAVIAVGFAAGVFTGGVDWGGVLGGLVPRFGDSGTVLLAASMLGATVMPHVIYLHSALQRDHVGEAPEPGRLPALLRAVRVDVIAALALAGAVNVSLLVLAAAYLRGPGDVTIESAYRDVTATLGPAFGILFAVGLLASGLASSSVGAYAGAVVLSGLTDLRLPMVVRRAVTLIPALVLLAVGAPPTATLIATQVVLSLGIPFALVPLIRLNRDPTAVGSHRVGRGVATTAWVVAGLIITLNVALVVLTARDLLR